MQAGSQLRTKAIRTRQTMTGHVDKGLSNGDADTRIDTMFYPLCSVRDVPSSAPSKHDIIPDQFDFGKYQKNSSVPIPTLEELSQNGQIFLDRMPGFVGKSEKSQPNVLPNTDPVTENTKGGKHSFGSTKAMLAGDIAQLKNDYYTQWLVDGTLLMKDGQGNFIKVVLDPTRQRDSRVISGDVFLRTSSIKSGIIDPEKKPSFSSEASYVAIPMKDTHADDSSFYKVFQRFSDGQLVPTIETGFGKKDAIEFNPTGFLPGGHRDTAFVRDYNIYYQPHVNESQVYPITTDGHKYKRYGVPNWLYEEEIFFREAQNTFWWSDSGNYLAYALLDDTHVTKMHIPHYKKEAAYPTYDDQAYPKSGTSNTITSLWMWSRMLNSTEPIQPPKEILEDNFGALGSYYVFSTKWISIELEEWLEESEDTGDVPMEQDLLVVVWANRIQNRVAFSICEFHKPCYTDIVVDFSMNGMDMWAEPADFKIFPSKTGFFVILPHAHTDSNVYNWVTHIKIERQRGFTLRSSITGRHGGAYDVQNIQKYIPERDELFFTAVPKFGQSHQYRVPTSSGADKIDPQCIDCPIRDCVDSKVNFSPDGNQFILVCRAPFKHAVMYLKRTDDILKNIELLNENGMIKASEQVQDFNYPLPQSGSVITSSGIEAYYYLKLPPNFQPDRIYPVLLSVYGGPNTYSPQFFSAHSTTRKNIDHIDVSIDGRGSANRGWKVKSPMYLHFGGPEMDDQIEVMRLLLKNNSFMDSRRVAVSGWSYGGYAASRIAIKDGGQTFKCALAGGTVSDWHFYDTAYTERYMRLPEQNPAGYASSTLLNRTAIQVFNKVKLLLMHGEADDNVHYQQSSLFAELLQEENIHFTQLVYANEGHGIRGRKSAHLLNEMDQFLEKECFSL
ncbi:prolyl oligopeptidase family domain-containing protein [Ditylenchus destructor]|uniref:Prolyl oligopeptidase family domain-containing protein n=1 Tax=Ditylenchus destructor TaxID=166010 RepID=A0AAD4N1C7_9BILA|nr:prolyl oligopeptidase family domain-containing protein [Ditylenchus destructor]